MVENERSEPSRNALVLSRYCVESWQKGAQGIVRE